MSSIRDNGGEDGRRTEPSVAHDMVLPAETATPFGPMLPEKFCPATVRLSELDWVAKRRA